MFDLVENVVAIVLSSAQSHLHANHHGVDWAERGERRVACIIVASEDRLESSQFLPAT